MSHHFQSQLQMTNNQNSTFDDKDSEKFYHKIENDNENLDSISSNPIISTPSNSALNNGDVCRDYLRNTCRRGNNCKFSHPEITHDGKKNDIMLLTFCHDFQNRECRRMNCKFIHCSKQEEETYKATGKLPSTVNMNNQGNNQNSNKFGPKKFNNNYQQNNFKDLDVPICKDFIKGDCFRGLRCKFRHVNKNDNQDRNFKNGNNYDSPFENKPYMSNMPNNCDNRYMMQRFDQMNQLKPNLIQNHMNSGMNRENSFPIPMNRRNSGMRMFEPEAKRRAFDSGYNTPTTFTFANNTNNLCVTTALNHHNQIHQSHSNGTSTANTDTNSTTAATAAVAAAAAAAAINEFNGSNVSTAATANTITRSMYSNLSDNRYLYEENNVLRRRIDELKQQVGDLMNANEFLLEQNAQLRNLANVLPATTVSQKQLQNNLHTVSTTLHNQVTAMHSTAVQKPPSSNTGPTNSQPPPPPIPIGPPNMATTDLLVAANHLHRQQQQQNQQQQRAAAAVAAVAAAAVAATSGAVSSMSSGVVPSSASGLSAASSISAMTTSTSTPLVSYPIMTASIPHSLGHLTH